MAFYAKMPFYKLCCPTLAGELILVSCQQTNAAGLGPPPDFVRHSISVMTRSGRCQPHTWGGPLPTPVTCARSPHRCPPPLCQPGCRDARSSPNGASHGRSPTLISALPALLLARPHKRWRSGQPPASLSARSSVPTGTRRGTAPAARSWWYNTPGHTGTGYVLGPEFLPGALICCWVASGSIRAGAVCWAGDVQALRGAWASRGSLLAQGMCCRPMGQHWLSGGSKTGPDATCNRADTRLSPAACTAPCTALAALWGPGGSWPPESQR